MKKARLTVLVMAAAMILSQAAYADNVIVATSPGNGGTSVSTSTGVTSSGTTTNTGWMGGGSVDVSNGAVITQTGPNTDSKNVNEKGYLVIGGDFNGASPSFNNGIGPGGGTTAQTQSVQTQTVQSQSVQSEATQPVGTGQTVAGAGSATAAAPSTQAVAPTDATQSSVAKPEINGGAAVLFDATTNEILFDKNGSTQMYPASTTKLMTALLAAERLNMGDSITFSSSAVNNLESGAVTAGMKTGDTMTVNDAMYAMMLRSACEVANGIAEKVAGSQSAFAELMNQRAKELGCTNTHFENASGLNGNHYTTARDMALITKAALNNATVRQVLLTKTYTLPATSSRGKLTCTNSNRLLEGGADYYEGIIGGKTGYTSKAGSCLASGIERNNHQLIAVVFKSNTTQYTDTKALYDYGLKRIAAGSNAVSQSSAVNASSGTGTSSSAAAAGGKWEQTTAGWKYKKADGSYCTNEWLDVNGNSYFFGSNSIMSVGWKQFTNGNWYYFNPENGAMVKGKWVTQDSKSYYLQNNGVMATNTVVEGKYRVNENGVYVEKVG